jgi:RNA polymerase sigma factor (sigma-70 family)
MTRASFSNLLHRVHDLVHGQCGAEQSDGQLLEAFVARQDQEAFAVVVQRHGPMVLGVCRRVLKNAHDAEDAFQATFLVLARKAATIARRESLGGWLYEVAYHGALRSKTNASRRQVRERQVVAMMSSDAQAEIDRQELCAVLDQELHQLPRKYRRSLVLCYLEGKTHTQAAQELGWPAGSMSRHLARGREILRGRLLRRGISLSSATIAPALLEATASAGVPQHLARTTVHTASLFAAGDSAAAPASVFQAIDLAEGILHSMTVAKLKLTIGWWLTFSVFGLGVGAWAYQFAAAQRPALPAAAAGTAPDQLPPAPTPVIHADRFGDPLPPTAVARLGTIRARHVGIQFVGSLPDNKTLTVSRDETVRIWEAATGKELRRWETSTGANQADLIRAKLAKGNVDMMALAAIMEAGGIFSSGIAAARLTTDAQTLALVGWDGVIRLWDVPSGKERRWVKPDPAIGAFSLALSPDGRLFALRSQDKIVRLYDAAAGKEIRQFGQKRERKKTSAYNEAIDELFLRSSNWCDFSFSSDGKTLLAAEGGLADETFVAQGAVTVWDLETGKQLRQLSQHSERQDGIFVLSPNGETLAFRRLDGTVRLWDAVRDREIREIGTARAGQLIAAVTFSPDSKQLAVRSLEGVTRLWDVATGKEVAQFGEPRGTRGMSITDALNGVFQLSNVVFSADGKTLMSEGHDNTIRQWEVAGAKEQLAANGHQGPVFTLVLSANGSTATTRGQDNTVRVWETASGKELQQFRLPVDAGANAFSPDGKRLAYGGDDGTVRVCDALTGQELTRLDGKFQLTDLAFAPDGQTLVTRDSDRIIGHWDASSGRQLRMLRKPVHVPAEAMLNFVVPFDQVEFDAPSLVVSPDGRCLASKEFHRGFFVWNQADRTLTQGDRNQLQLWDVTTGRALHTIQGPQSEISAFAFSPDGKGLAVARRNRTLTLYEVASGKERAPFIDAQAQGFITALAFSPDGRTLAAGGADRGIRFWDVPAAQAIGRHEGHQGAVTSLAFASDGRTLISGSADTTALVWNTARLSRATRPESRSLTTLAADELWADLTDNDAGRAYRAVRALSDSPQGVALLEARLRAVPPPDDQRLARLISELTSERFAVRQNAASEIVKLGELAEPALRQALAGKPPLELGRRIEQSLERIQAAQVLSAEQLRAVRAIEALEHIGNDAARRLLKKLAGGAAGARVTREAQASLQRHAW